LILLRLALLSLLLQPLVLSADPAYVLKFATLAPQGSTWMNLLETWGRQLESQSQGRLTVKFYPGGIAGDEPDVLRKIRFGQLQGAAVSGHGIGEVYSPARVLEVPFLFRDHAEIDYVRTRLMPTIDAGMRKNGFEMVGWMEVGFVHFFSTKPVTSLEDMRARRIWQWQGDRFIAAFFSASHWSPVSLPISDVYMGLSTGLVDTVMATPLSSIALQWFTKTPYMSEIPMANGIGALLVSSKFFATLPPDLQRLVRDTGHQTGLQLIAATRRDDKNALEVLKRNGVRTTFGWNDVKRDELMALRDQAVAELEKTGYISSDIRHQVDAALAEYRALPRGTGP
jgi:TRAP-type C4-dicarboxylate transport system substrate-binding protein